MAPFTQQDLIREVQIRPGLWDPVTHPMDSTDKLQQWKDIGAALFKDWNSLNKANAYDRVLQLQKKWRSLKDGYGREIRYRKRGIARRTYVFFKKLSFLGGLEGLPEPPEYPDKYKRPPDSDDNDTSQDIEQAPADDTELTEDDPLTEPIRKKKKKQSKRRYRDTNESEPERIEITVDSDSNSDDSDRQFLLSYVPEMKKLPSDIKMWVWAQIANIMQEAVERNLSNTTPFAVDSSTVQDFKNYRRPPSSSD